MLKILYIITQSELGGAQKNVLDLAAELKDRYEILIAAGLDGGGELFNALTKQNIPARQLKYLRRVINPYFDWLAFWEIKRLIAEEKPDILHLHSSKAGALGSLAARFIRRRPKVIYTVHGAVFSAAFPWLTRQIFLWIEKLTAITKDKIICVSANDKNLWLKYRVAPEEKLTIIYNGIDAGKIDFLEKNKAREELFKFLDVGHPEIQMPQYLGCLTSPKTKIVGTIANFYPEKGLPYLIKAAEIMNKNTMAPETIFMVIGEGRDRKMLEEMIKERNLENKFFLTGTIDNAACYLKALDVFVLPSIKEGFPYAILETLAARVPIVATSVGGVAEIIRNEENGLLVESKNPVELAEKIERLLKNPELAEKLTLTGQNTLLDFSKEKMAQQTERVYLEK